MTRKHYDWSNGPDLIQPHSIAKHRILQAYLAAYYRTLASSPNQDVLRLTLVDGFAGGGLYHHADTKVEVKGSPLVLLNATKEAEYLINKDRGKPLHLDVSYIFIESNKATCAHLESTLKKEGYGGELGKTIHLEAAKFQDKVADIISFIKKKSPRNGRSIFILDQYGYKDVPTALIKNIFNSLPSSEVILTFGMDSLLNFISESDLSKRLLTEVGLPDVLQGKSIDEIKKSEKDWRLFVQSKFYQGLVTNCGAKHYTPFFIRNQAGHGDYWLIHMSQHHRARDVMTQVHWDNSNYFIHYGGSGMDMFSMNGYDPIHDLTLSGQGGLGFEFDDIARKASIKALTEQIPHRIYSNDSGSSFETLFATTCNHSPATQDIYRSALGELLELKEVEVISADGVNRRSANQIKSTDQIISPRQAKFIFNTTTVESV